MSERIPTESPRERASLLWDPPPEGLELVPGDIHVFGFVFDLPSVQISSLEAALSADEISRAGRFKFPDDRRRFVVGRGVLRTILGRQLKREPAALRFQFDVHGKPSLREGEAEDTRFNVSASGDLGLVALRTEHELGVDVECTRPLSDALSMAEMVFADEERAALHSLRGERLDAAFFSLWTRKEAVVKCLGRGFSHSLRSFSVDPVPRESPEEVIVGSSDAPESVWVHALPSPRAGYLAALATARAASQVRCYRWPGV